MPLMMTQGTNRSTVQDFNKHDKVRYERNTLQDLARSEMCSMQDLTKYRNKRTRWSIDQPLPIQVSRLSL